MTNHAAGRWSGETTPIRNPILCTSHRRRWLVLPLLAVLLLPSACRKTSNETRSENKTELAMQQKGDCSCPENITTNQELADSEPGWVVRSDDPRNTAELGRLHFFEGDPRQGGVERPPKKSKIAKRVGYLRLAWRLEQSAGGKDIWMACEYYRSSVWLLRRVSKEVTECSAVLSDRYLMKSDPITCR